MGFWCAHPVMSTRYFIFQSPPCLLCRSFEKQQRCWTELLLSLLRTSALPGASPPLAWENRDAGHRSELTQGTQSRLCTNTISPRAGQQQGFKEGVFLVLHQWFVLIQALMVSIGAEIPHPTESVARVSLSGFSYWLNFTQWPGKPDGPNSQNRNLLKGRKLELFINRGGGVGGGGRRAV